MSVYFYLFNKNTKECLCLGKKRNNDSIGYQGPAVFVDGNNYFLPDAYLEILIQRFKEGNTMDSVIILPDYELFDTQDYVPEDEKLMEIGGEGFGDIPITKYFPELINNAIKEDIKKQGKLIK